MFRSKLSDIFRELVFFGCVQFICHFIWYQFGTNFPKKIIKNVFNIKIFEIIFFRYKISLYNIKLQ